MPAKIATAEDVQAELQCILAMTEGDCPSRSKLSRALIKLASRIDDPSKVRIALFGNSLWDGIQKSLEEFSEILADKLASELEGWKVKEVGGMAANQLKTVMVFDPVETAETKKLPPYLKKYKLTVYATLTDGLKIKLFGAYQSGSGEILHTESTYDSFSGTTGVASGFAKDLRASVGKAIG
jgi:hypothetical protein